MGLFATYFFFFAVILLATLYSTYPLDRFHVGSSLPLVFITAELFSISLTAVCCVLSFSHVYALMTTWVPKLSVDCFLLVLSLMFWDSWLFPFLHCIRLSLLFYLQFTLDALCVTQLCILAHFFLALASPLVFYLLSYCLISVGSHVLFFSLTTLHAVILPGIMVGTSLLMIGFLWRVQGHQLTLSTMMFLSLFQYAILMSALVWGSAEMDLFRCFCGLYATSVACFLMLALLQSSVVGRMGELCVVVVLGVMAVGLPPVRYGLAKWKVMAEVHKVAFGAVVTC